MKKENIFKHIHTIVLDFKDELLDNDKNKSFEVLVCNKLYSEELVQNYPNYLFVFGDNSKRIGLGGQAVIRNCDNVFGFVTKLAPTNDESSFLDDTICNKYKRYVNSTINLIKYIFEVNNTYNTLVFPYTGLGNGLAKMPEKAPKCYEYLKKALKKEFNYEF